MDDTIGKVLREKVKELPPIDSIRVHEAIGFDDRFLVVQMPRPWRYELIEAWYPNTAWNPLGKQIEFVRSDAPDANAAVSQANRLISSEKLPILIGTYASPLALAATEVAERNQVIYWEMGGISDPIVQRGFKYLFRITPMGSMYGGKAADYSKEVLAPKLGIAPDKLKVSIVHEDALYGTTVGTGAEAVAGKAVIVHYTGWLYDPAAPGNKGAKFDSSVDRKVPFGFILGAGRVIRGWDEGVAGMKVGEANALERAEAAS